MIINQGNLLVSLGDFFINEELYQLFYSKILGKKLLNFLHDIFGRQINRLRAENGRKKGQVPKNDNKIEKSNIEQASDQKWPEKGHKNRDQKIKLFCHLNNDNGCREGLGEGR